MTTPSTDEREQLARLLFSRLSLHPIKDLYDTRSHSEGTRKIWREEADAILSAGFRLPVPTTPTHRCVNCKREWQETQLEVWQGFPVQQRCPECKSACAKMDPVPTPTDAQIEAIRERHEADAATPLAKMGERHLDRATLLSALSAEKARADQAVAEAALLLAEIEVQFTVYVCGANRGYHYCQFCRNKVDDAPISQPLNHTPDCPVLTKAPLATALLAELAAAKANALPVGCVAVCSQCGTPLRYGNGDKGSEGGCVNPQDPVTGELVTCPLRTQEATDAG